MRIWMSIIAAAALAATAPARAEVVEFDGAEIVVGAPLSYCTIGDGQFSILQTLLLSEDPGDILTSFARCDELAEVEAGSAATVRHYGLIVGLRDEAGDPARPGVELDAYHAIYDGLQAEGVNAGPHPAMVGLNGDHDVDVEPMGLVSAGEQAHFGALTLRPHESGEPAIVGVIGRTLIAGRVVQIELYAPEEEAPIPDLILLGRETVSALWEANPGAAGVAIAGAETSAEEAGAGEEESEEAYSQSDAEEEPLAAEEEPSGEEQALAEIEALMSEGGAALQAVYWLIVGYLAASLALGIGIYGFFKLRPRPA
jgi:hypothetical protein